MIKALIVDDEPLSRSRLIRLTEALGIDVVGEGENGADACRLVSTSDAHILFLDINMPVKNGITAAYEISMLPNPPAIVFCTAYDDYAIDAFKTGAIAYLSKPVTIEDLSAAIDKARRVTRAQLESILENDESLIRLSVEDAVSTKRMPISHFVAFFSSNKHVFARTIDGKELLVDYTLKDLEQTFSGYLIRAHRSVLVNRSRISAMEKVSNGSHKLIMDGGFSAAVSRRHLTTVKQCFN